KRSVRTSVATPLELVCEPSAPFCRTPAFVSKRTRIPERGRPSASSTTAVMFERPDSPGTRRRLAGLAETLMVELSGAVGSVLSQLARTEKPITKIAAAWTLFRDLMTLTSSPYSSLYGWPSTVFPAAPLRTSLMPEGASGSDSSDSASSVIHVSALFVIGEIGRA